MAYNDHANNALRGLIDDMTAEMPKGEKYIFYKAATEALVTDKDITNKTKLLTRLYSDISAKSLIDFEDIPKCKGDITKYKHYNVILSTLETLNKIFADNENEKFEEVMIMNRLHDLLITLKPDFMYGYLHGIEFIMMQFNTLVLSLVEIENICIMSYLKYVRDVKASSVSFYEFRRKDLLVLRGAKEFISCYDRGEWNTIMKALKKSSKPATEATLPGAGQGELASDPNSDAFIKVIKNVMNGVTSNLSTFTNPTLKKIFSDKHIATAGKIVGGVGVLVTLFVGLRWLISYFYSKAARVSDTLKLQVQFIEAVQNDERALNPKTAKMANRLVDLANKVVGVIDYKIFAGNIKAQKDIQMSNKALASDVQDMVNNPDTGDADDGFQLM